MDSCCQNSPWLWSDPVARGGSGATAPPLAARPMHMKRRRRSCAHCTSALRTRLKLTIRIANALTPRHHCCWLATWAHPLHVVYRLWKRAATLHQLTNWELWICVVIRRNSRSWCEWRKPPFHIFVLVSSAVSRRSRRNATTTTPCFIPTPPSAPFVPSECVAHSSSFLARLLNVLLNAEDQRLRRRPCQRLRRERAEMPNRPCPSARFPVRRPLYVMSNTRDLNTRDLRRFGTWAVAFKKTWARLLNTLLLNYWPRSNRLSYRYKITRKIWKKKHALRMHNDCMQSSAEEACLCLKLRGSPELQCLQCPCFYTVHSLRVFFTWLTRTF